MNIIGTVSVLSFHPPITDITMYVVKVLISYFHN